MLVYSGVACGANRTTNLVDDVTLVDETLVDAGVTGANPRTTCNDAKMANAAIKKLVV